MRIQTVKPSDGPAVLQLEGDLDAASSPQLKAGLLALLDAADRGVVVDLAGVPFIDSSGLGALVAGLKSARQREIGFALAGIQVAAQAIFTITMADHVFEIFPTAEAASAFLAGARKA